MRAKSCTHARSVVEDTVDEERRLMYVGITRAKRRLIITFAGSRSRFGTRMASMPSRFLFEMSGQELPPGWQPYTPGGQKAKKKAARRKATRGKR